MMGKQQKALRKLCVEYFLQIFFYTEYPSRFGIMFSFVVYWGVSCMETYDFIIAESGSLVRTKRWSISIKYTGD